ncbi:Serine/threonine-protein kinase [Ceratobasidium sp. AG-Ba]|nr:Serine/threonine-protein kinase [Ceratobasidium sp. AG-Ba]
MSMEGQNPTPIPVPSLPKGAGEMLRHLTTRGCKDLTEKLDTVSRYPFHRGGFGKIYKGRLHDGTWVAIKLLARKKRDQGQVKRKAAKRAVKESYTWFKCKNPGIHELLGVARFGNCIAMVSPWVKAGTLPEYISDHPDVDRLQLAYQVASGLAYLHLSGTVHGDLKGSNILISDNGRANLADFGNSKLRDDTLCFTTTTSCGGFSARYAAPELIEGGPQTLHSDMYALGMTILEIISGQVPHSDIKLEFSVMYQVATLGRLPSRPNNQHMPTGSAGNKLWSLMMACWDKDPSHRPGAAFVRDQLKIISGDTHA